MQNKKLFYFGVGLLFIIILIGGYLVFARGPVKYFICSDHYAVFCYQDSEKVKNILCSSDKDCSVKNMSTYCHPGAIDQIESPFARYYCGDDGYCMGCDCGWFGIFLRPLKTSKEETERPKVEISTETPSEEISEEKTTDWNTYDDDWISFKYPPDFKYQSKEEQIDFIKEGGVAPTLSFLSFSSSQLSLEDWLSKISSGLGDEIIWKEVRNDIAGDARDGILYEELTKKGKRIGYMFNHSDDYNDLTYSFWNENPEERNLFFEMLSTIKLKFAFDISKWKIYENEKYGFEIKYPLDWEYIEGKQMDPEKKDIFIWEFIAAFSEKVPVEEYPLVIIQKFSDKEVEGAMFKKGSLIIDVVAMINGFFPRRHAIVQKMLSTFKFLD